MQYKVGSFNMNNWSFTSKKDFEKIAEIIIEEKLDVVALQEILSEGKGISRMQEELAQCVKYNLYDWDFCPHKGESAVPKTMSKDHRGEGYAYLWNKNRFKLLEYSKMGEIRIFDPRIINSKSKDVNVDCSFFARTPYYIRLQPLYGGFFELRLVNVHIYHGKDNSISTIDRKSVV